MLAPCSVELASSCVDYHPCCCAATDCSIKSISTVHTQLISLLHQHSLQYYQASHNSIAQLCLAFIAMEAQLPC